jgi:RNA polymerase-binding transcription factor DksA
MNEPLAQTRGGARDRLIAARQRIVEEMERFRGDVDDPGEPEPPEGASALEESVTDTLAAIDCALGRLAAGSYGRCQHCGQEIGQVRLAALPHAASCVRCQRRVEDAVA